MDELVSFLHQSDPAHIVVGKQDCNLLVLGDSGLDPTALKLLLLPVGCQEEITPRTIETLRSQYRHDLVFRSLVQCGQQLAALTGLPFFMVGYSICPTEALTPTFLGNMKFLVQGLSPTSAPMPRDILDSPSFANFLHYQLGFHAELSGTHKPKNKHVADAFHVWSRCYLSSRVVKQDFDALYAKDGQFATIEVKRSPVIPLERWKPFSDDAPNYDIQFRFSQRLGAPFFTFHHNGGPCDHTTPIGCYRINQVDLCRSRWIQYHKSLIHAGDILPLLDKALQAL